MDISETTTITQAIDTLIACVTGQLAFIHEPPNITGILKQFPEDFKVVEQLPFNFTGTGEHAYLNIAKKGLNTQDIVTHISRTFHLNPRLISFAGMKDKQAETQQWFSIHLPGKADLNWQDLNSDNIHVLSSTRHDKKLKRGALACNHFELRIRNICGDKDKLQSALQRIKKYGFPNYFGNQRFGFDGYNIRMGYHLLALTHQKISRHKKGIYLSALRSAIFNLELNHIVQTANWPEIDEKQKISLLHTDNVEQLRQALPEYKMLLEQIFPGLVKYRVEREDRALKVSAGDLSWSISEDELQLSFSLPKGSYATTMLREILISLNPE